MLARPTHLCLLLSLLLLASCGSLGGGVGLTPSDVSIATDPAFVDAEVDKGWLIVEAEINGVGPFRFVVDTGASALYVRKDAAERVGLRMRGASIRSRDAAGNTRKLRTTRIDSLRLGDAEFTDLGAVVADFPDWATFDGLIGFGVFHDVTLTLDYANGRIGVSDRRLEADDHRGVRFTLEHAVPTVQGRIDWRQVGFLVDSGSQDFIAINENEADGFGFTGELRDSALVGTSTATFRQKSGRLVQNVRIGPVIVERPIVAVDRSPTLIGARLLREFDAVHFDQRSRVMTFDERKDWTITVEPLRSTGVGLRRSGLGWIVRDVLPGSGASEAGVRLGDRLIRLNGRDGGSMTDNDLRDLIMSESMLVYELERGGRPIEVQLEVDTLVP